MKFTAVVLCLVVVLCNASMDKYRQSFEVSSNYTMRLSMIYKDRRHLTPFLDIQKTVLAQFRDEEQKERYLMRNPASHIEGELVEKQAIVKTGLRRLSNDEEDSDEDDNSDEDDDSDEDNEEEEDEESDVEEEGEEGSEESEEGEESDEDEESEGSEEGEGSEEDDEGDGVEVEENKVKD